ncbi:FAD:protein FMN transferase, partial [Mycobacterium tuberculosis]|nr:FAD:protein FMN transferase [Mycobacterium tuberculosis]
LTVSAGATLDLGSSAKAFAAHQWSTEIAGRVGAGILLDLGGDLAYAGPSPSGGWRVGVVDWTGTTRQVVVADGGQSFATSSTKVRVW